MMIPVLIGSLTQPVYTAEMAFVTESVLGGWYAIGQTEDNAVLYRSLHRKSEVGTQSLALYTSRGEGPKASAQFLNSGRYNR